MSSLLYIAPEDVAHRDAPVASGTPEYISPEQIHGHDIDGRADLYSVGIVLYEMLSGRRPFTATSPTDLMRAHLDADPPGFADIGLGEQIPAAVEDVVRSCLAKTPDDRPRSAEELALRFEQALGKRVLPIRSASATPAGTPPPTPAATPANAPHTTPPSQRVPTRGVMQHSIEVQMLEAMALIKLKGFIHDLGGEVIESIPGLIRVRLGGGPEDKKKSGLLGWLDRTPKPTVIDPVQTTVLELRMERHDPNQPNKLTITLVVLPGKGLMTTEWRSRCKKIGIDLKAYLMGR
jgi:eukaryotic-like serine/threonine-protein kinase